MKSITRIAALVALLGLCVPASATTTLPLNTGYNYLTFSQYPATAGTQDNYWINIASYFPGVASVPVGPSYVVPPYPGWFPGPFAPQGGAWISARNTNVSSPGTNVNNPAYTIFRKCFCLMPGFKNASLRFTARADDNIQVWFNSMTNQLLTPSQGHFNGTPLGPVGTEKGFRAGKNCIYALVEDQHGVAMGFYLDGSVTADGLLPSAAAGVGQSFAPCSCQAGLPGQLDAAGPRDAAVLERRAQTQAEEEERRVIDAIIKVAEARRVERQREKR